MDQAELDAGLARYISHLREVEGAFNEWAAHVKLPVRMSGDAAITAAEAGIGLARIAPFWTRTDDTGIVHSSQLKTAIDCLVELRDTPKRCGHVVGAMQSGKTTTSLALQWAGPVLYLLTGNRAVPFYVIGNQTNHEDQTKTELDRFLSYYGNLEITSTDPSRAGSVALDAVFVRSASLNNYREHVLRGTLEDVYAIPQLGDMVHRRVGGDQSVHKIAELCRRATEGGYRPLMIIDEPQFGASDRMVVNDESGTTERRACVLVQIFDRIQRELGSSREDHWFVGLSATPFELNDLERVWEVRQYLTPAYSGFNFFNGEPIAQDVLVTSPKTLGLSAFAAIIKTPFLANVSMAAYEGSAASFARHAAKIDFTKDQDTYQEAVHTALRTTIYALLQQYANDPKWPIGLCIRAFNDNGKTLALIGRLGLDPKRIEIVEYFGQTAGGVSVKRMISRRKHPDLPYVVFVTNRARMADAFPTEVRFFMDFAQRASDLNALLQGLLGRACGYNKKSTVVLSDESAGIVDAYVATNGGYVHRTSRHSVAVGGFRRGAPTGMLKLRDDMDDPVVRQFFQEINQQVVTANIPAGSQKLRVPRATGSAAFRTGPILRIAEALNLFDHIEKPNIRGKIFPEIPTGFQVARRGERVRHTRKPGVTLTYSIDRKGDCRYTFRWSDRGAAAQGGAAGRAMGKKDIGQHMEPTIYVEKYDPTTGDVINDRGADLQRPGDWRAFMVTFPLKEPVREIRAADVAYPTELSPYDDWMEPHERDLRDRQERPAAQGGPEVDA